MEPNRLNYIVKITLYKGFHVDKVIYYQYDVPHTIVSKYRWYYEYLQALVKVKHPKEHVDLYIKQNDDCFLAGQYYIDKKTKTLLSSKRGQLKKLQNTKYSDDLFGSVGMKVESKMATLESEISDLEKGIFNFWYPPTYINLIKQYI